MPSEREAEWGAEVPAFTPVRWARESTSPSKMGRGRRCRCCRTAANWQTLVEPGASPQLFRGQPKLSASSPPDLPTNAGLGASSPPPWVGERCRANARRSGGSEVPASTPVRWARITSPSKMGRGRRCRLPSCRSAQAKLSASSRPRLCPPMPGLALLSPTQVGRGAERTRGGVGDRRCPPPLGFARANHLSPKSGGEAAPAVELLRIGKP